MSTLIDVFFHLQRQLLPLLEEEIGPLSPLDEQFGQVIALTDLGPLLRRYEWVGNGKQFSG